MFKALFGIGENPVNIRMPDHFKPLEYDLRIWPHVLEESSWFFEGDVKIRVECHKWSRIITLHSRDLRIDEEDVKVTTDDLDEIEVVKHAYDPSNNREFYRIYLEEEMEPGDVLNVFIPFSGTIGTAYRGMFYEVYKEDRKEEHMVATHFQPISARAVFPCFDEPQFKTPFKISVARPRDGSLHSYSNMPIVGTKEVASDKRYVWDVCQKSPPMPTYLATFVVANFQTKTASDWFQRLICRPSMVDETRYAYKILPYVFHEARTIFRIPYTLPKLDHIAIVGWIGGMEHYGLISYGEDSISVDPEEKGLAYNRRKNMALCLICHETCHMWLGNLVTTKWWDTIWLNEGITQFFTHYMASKVDPSSNAYELLPVSLAERAMLYDGERTAMPMVDKIKDYLEIPGAFNARRCYYKGAAVTNMMMHFMTEARFMSAMVHYVKRFANENVEQSDFFEMLDSAINPGVTIPSSHSIEQIMDPWTRQPGFPLVTVTRDYKTNTAQFTQKRYRNINMNLHTDPGLWMIPITYTTEPDANFESTTPDFWMARDKEVHKLPKNLDDDDWLLVNVRRIGYYRVNYDKKNWQMLVEQLQRDPSEIHVINRAQIISDAFVLANNNLVDWSIVKGLSEYLKDEEDFLPWLAASKHIPTLAYYLPDYQSHRQWAAQLILDGQSKLMATSAFADAASSVAESVGLSKVGQRKVAAVAEAVQGTFTSRKGKPWRKGADQSILMSILNGLQIYLEKGEDAGEFTLPEESFWDDHICRMEELHGHSATRKKPDGNYKEDERQDGGQFKDQRKTIRIHDDNTDESHESGVQNNSGKKKIMRRSTAECNPQ